MARVASFSIGCVREPGMAVYSGLALVDISGIMTINRGKMWHNADPTRRQHRLIPELATTPSPPPSILYKAKRCCF